MNGITKKCVCAQNTVTKCLPGKMDYQQFTVAHIMFRAIRNARNEFNSVCQYCKHSWNSPFLTWKIKRKICCLILFRIRVQNFLINLMREKKKGTTPTESTFDEVDQTFSTKFFSLYETFPKTRKILQLFISMEFGHHEVCTFTIWIVLLSSFLCHKRLRSFFSCKQNFVKQLFYLRFHAVEMKNIETYSRKTRWFFFQPWTHKHNVILFGIINGMIIKKGKHRLNWSIVFICNESFLRIHVSGSNSSEMISLFCWFCFTKHLPH